jgi:hypothetical protein
MTKLYSMFLIGSLALAAHAATFTGVITDTMCGARHEMMKDQPDVECVRVCAKGQYAYALFDGRAVLKLSDQKTAARYAAERVKVTGTLDERTHTIKVALIELEGDSK